MNKDPQIETLFGEARRLLAGGRLAEAEARIGKLQRLAAGDPRLAPLEITLLQRAGRFSELAAKYRALLEQVPGDENLAVGLALAELQAGNARQALATAKQAQKRHPGSLPVLQALAVSAMSAREWLIAARAFRALAEAQPRDPLLHKELSRAEAKLGHTKRAKAAFAEYLKLTPNPGPEDYFRRGHLHFIDREPEEAAAWLDKARDQGFESAELLAMRAHCHIHASEIDKAKAAFERAIELDPDNLEAHFRYRQLVKTGPGDPIFEKMEGLKSKKDLDVEWRILLGFLLGNLYQEIGEYGRAFENYGYGNRAIAEKFGAEGYPYQPEKDAREHAAIKKTFTRKIMKQLAAEGSDDTRPVFIVGMPRSGTTLLEQIISSHSRAEGRGEVEAMHFIHFDFDRALEADPKGGVAAAVRKHRGDWQRRYLEAVAGNGSGALRLTDKMPVNYKSLGLIAMLFPKARLIHIRRDPRDVAVSIYCNIFERGHPYSTTLAGIGRTYRLYRGLMEHWRKTLPVPLLEVDYEKLVEDQEAQSKRVIEFCGLAWEPQCLDFHRRKKAAITLSSLQVRKPMSKASIGKWKHYEQHLGPFLDALEGK